MYPRDVVELIVAALPPGMVKSVLLCANLAGGSVSGVVEDADEPGGGYISEWELADGAVYLVLGVDVTSDCAGVMQLDGVGGVED
jgi:hypothetical protein